MILELGSFSLIKEGGPQLMSDDGMVMLFPTLHSKCPSSIIYLSVNYVACYRNKLKTTYNEFYIHLPFFLKLTNTTAKTPAMASMTSKPGELAVLAFVPSIPSCSSNSALSLMFSAISSSSALSFRSS